MFTLRVLGSLALEGPEPANAGRRVHRRRLALLAVLASPPGTRVNVQNLAALLWPDASHAEARRRLSIALRDLGATLGELAIVMDDDGIRVDPALLTTDAAAFEAAVADEDWPAAVSLHTGPFLGDFSFRGMPELERWAEARSASLSRMFERALEQLANLRAAEGDRAGEIGAWRELTTLQPTSGRIATAYMRALAAAGDVDAALRHAEYHNHRLRTELDASPDPDVSRLTEQLRQSTTRLQPAEPGPALTRNADPPHPDTPDSVQDAIKRKLHQHATTLIIALTAVTALLAVLTVSRC